MPRGTPKAQRVDLNAPAAGTTEYGERQQVEESLRQNPMPVGRNAPSAQVPTPNDVPNLTGPSQRPHEPIQSGLAQGPGVGPLIAEEDYTAVLAAIYEKYPHPGIRRRLERAQGRRRKP